MGNGGYNNRIKGFQAIDGKTGGVVRVCVLNGAAGREQR